LRIIREVADHDPGEDLDGPHRVLDQPVEKCFREHAQAEEPGHPRARGRRLGSRVGNHLLVGGSPVGCGPGHSLGGDFRCSLGGLGRMSE
jgi:hypothetical protein